jgi:hypothetical protein
MGVDSGPVSGVIDVNGQANLAGAGLNIAQRVMDSGDAVHLTKIRSRRPSYHHPLRPHLHSKNPALPADSRFNPEARRIKELAYGPLTQGGPASVRKVPLFENQPLIPTEGAP